MLHLKLFKMVKSEAKETQKVLTEYLQKVREENVYFDFSSSMCHYLRLVIICFDVKFVSGKFD